jgi:cold shock CspA family protein
LNQKGLLTAWNDAKGFGFIKPEGNGERVFAHISSYAGRGRPDSNRQVTYSLARDGQGRLRAGSFQYEQYWVRSCVLPLIAISV